LSTTYRPNPADADALAAVEVRRHLVGFDSQAATVVGLGHVAHFARLLNDSGKHTRFVVVVG
jgi:hypothetical protein